MVFRKTYQQLKRAECNTYVKIFKQNMMNSSTRSFFKIAGAGCLLSIGCVQAYAQTRSAVNGIVQDERGESLPGATITLSNTDNKFNATALTN